MKDKILKIYLLIVTLVMTSVLVWIIPLNKDKNPFIIDLDFSTDVDDVCAVRVADSLDKQGVIDLKAMMLCVDGENIVEAMDGLLDYDNMDNVSIGKSSKNLDIVDTSPYWDTLSMYNSADTKREVEDSVKLYRQILDRSLNKVTIVTTGYVTNIAELLKSEPDEISRKTGAELVRDKVKAIYITGGAYPEGYDNNFFFLPEARDSIIYTLENCEAPIYLISSNNGAPFTCGGKLQALDTERNDPVSRALDATGFSDGRAAWDPFSVWVAACGFEQTRTYTEKVNITIRPEDGYNIFEQTDTGKLYRVQRVDDNFDWYKTELDELTLIGTDFESIGEQ